MESISRFDAATAMYNAANPDPLTLGPVNKGLERHIDSILWGQKLKDFGAAGRLLKVFLRYVYALGRDVFSGQLTLRAMSLVYTTLLSVVPLIAFSFSVLKGLGVHNRLEPQLFRFLAPLGEQGAEITRQVIDLVDNVKGGVLGGVALAFFVYTAISMVQKVEESFNYVWHVAKPRALGRRLAEYTVVLLIGPVVIVIALGIIASLRSTAVVQYILSNELTGTLVVATGKFLPYLLVTGVFTFLYVFIPNARVRFRSALVGGLAAGFLWATISGAFATFVVYSTQRMLIYSGFAVAITTLIWLYLNWLVLLIGAQLAYYHQNTAFLRLGRREPRLSNAMREKLALNIMLLVGRAFRHPDQSTTIADIAKKLRVPSIALEPIIESLEESGLLTTTEKEMLLPAREMSRIALDDILAAVRKHGDTGSYRDPKWARHVAELLRDVESAIREQMANRSLADFVDEADAAS